MDLHRIKIKQPTEYGVPLGYVAGVKRTTVTDDGLTFWLQQKK